MTSSNRVVKFGFYGDSSLYTKSDHKKGSMKGDMMDALDCDEILWSDTACAEIVDITKAIMSGPPCRVMGISMFGNGLLDAVHQRSSLSVFFVGGFSEKYNYAPIYDIQMNWVRHYLEENGAVVVSGEEEVSLRLFQLRVRTDFF